MTDNVRAALIIIGDEILSGRTQDKNTSYIAIWLNEAGIQLAEVRVVADNKQAIVSAVNALRSHYDYVFTTGGIGPTHDDITAECVAAAFGLDLITNVEAYDLLLDYYGEAAFTPARQRMARTPKGAELIQNRVSLAPGFQVENVFVLAGVPKIMQVMLEALRPRLRGGAKVWSKTVTIYTGESNVAELLTEVEGAFESVSLGSYPFFQDGIVGTQIVGRSRDKLDLEKAMSAVAAGCDEAGFEYEQPTDFA